jgi:uncharacterized damage-inducible protein DinB
MKDLIDQYESGGEQLALSLRGLTPQDLLCVPPADANVGRWSIQHVVIHLADAEQVLAERMKRVIAEENPQLLAFDENKWASRLEYDEQSAEDAAQLVELTRRQLARVLRKLTPADFERSGTHSESGRKTLADLLQTAVEHVEHHVKFIHEKRKFWGKEMW